MQSLAYGVSGALKTVQYSNLTQSSYTQDLMGRTASVTAANQASGTTAWASGNYAYDGAGNIRSIGADTFNYDVLSRLLSATVGHSFQGGSVTVQVGYTYDNFGNLLTRDILNDAAVQAAIGTTEAQALERRIAINAAIASSGYGPTNRLASLVLGYNSNGVVPQATVVPAYDANGNLTSDGTNTVAYDALNQAVTTNIPSDGVSPASTEYAFYDTEGERAAVVRYAGAPLTLSSASLYARSGAQVVGEVRLAYSAGQVTEDKAKAYLYAGPNLAASQEGVFVAAPATYTITASAGTGGSISPSGTVQVSQGASQTFTITPSAGYRIASVTVDGVNQGAVGSYTFSNVTSNHTISAAFSAASSYTLTVSVGTGAAGTPGTGTYTYAAGTSVGYSYALQAGYTNLTVKLDGVTVAASGTVTMNASHTLTVTATSGGGTYSIAG